MGDAPSVATVGLRLAISEDVDRLAELRAVVLRPDLERLGRYDDVRVRQRFRDAFDPAATRIIVVNGEDVGCVALRREGEAHWLEHFYIATSHQGVGVGTKVLEQILDAPALYRLNVLQGSPARRLYQRHGFVVDQQDAVDVFMTVDRRAQPPVGDR
ncbi:GNAT family N-acetyltransferase [Microbacterium sp. W4I20]|uniref:GNAT family N-acetyltransferase n=1 Tax=Microbacterium sp. W4I20 TaxID=3042262 RepID=UPI002781533A|nr:GNAT family N-acetyltransferase [Microbacterium sp. W4I20]MDQ0725863.1 GNAT superfamily N-acetyltransferase [Microbacterium sp. W4I20]